MFKIANIIEILSNTSELVDRAALRNEGLARTHRHNPNTHPFGAQVARWVLRGSVQNVHYLKTNLNCNIYATKKTQLYARARQ